MISGLLLLLLTLFADRVLHAGDLAGGAFFLTVGYGFSAFRLLSSALAWLGGGRRRRGGYGDDAYGDGDY